MKNTIFSEKITFISDSFNVEPWVLRFNEDDTNYIWHSPPGKTLGAALCFPLLGNLPENRYTLNGKEYSMDQHGFAKDYDYGVVDFSRDSITYEITNNRETYLQYPYLFRFRVIYTVEGTTLKTEYRVKNFDEKELYFSVGGHPRFACPCGGVGSFNDYYIEFEEPESINNIVKSYGPIDQIEKYLSSDGKKLFLDYSLFSKGCFCFQPVNSQYLRLKSDKAEGCLRIDLGGVTHLQFWAPVGGAFIAIEPWYGSITSIPPKKIDSDWIKRPGTLHVSPGNELKFNYSVTINE